ncbi:GNAT family N-acetyltransferase [Chryseolinea sp. H1M3-3]|uniref:GNAT family N-acetyltransferase n=1 Tax=Chryseolinea sp. H1M3-3 TaxID=3034144 RepID=UPI0023ED5D64|nr:GNAT family N-acetyltransferase [Chryseolinea sp. H1M3-3]
MNFRKATKADVPHIVRMLANDPLGALREDLKHFSIYEKAFELISKDEHQELMVAESDDGEVIGTFHLTFIQYLTHQGSIRAQIESVRVREDHRGKGIGEKMFTWAIQRAKDKGANLVQLTSDKKRPDAIRFYERLGFVASHEGFKLFI